MEHKLFKYGEAIAFDESAIHSSDSVLSDPEMVSRFQKLASGLKRIAPKANDFLYFSAVMMHAAEASTINNDGTPKKFGRNSENVAATWEKKGESVRWVCNDPSINPYRNSNGDIFPEEELLKAYKKWVGKPLCIDHKSSSVDFVRGVIIDTYYDRIGKRVIALCALDKISFPELARKVATGVSTCVSMGTAVGRAVCTDCGTVARTEHDFCNHMRTKSCYGEINLDLQPIELSIVVTGADPQAKIREILASANHLNRRAEEAEQQLNSLSTQNATVSGSSIRNVVANIKEGLDALIHEFEGSDKAVEDVTATTVPEMVAVASEQNDDSSVENSSEEANNTESVVTASDDSALKDKFNSLRDAIQQKISKIEEDFNTLFTLGDGLKVNTMEKKSYFQGAGDVNEPTPGQPKYEKDPLAEKTRNTEDRQMTGIVNTGPVDGLFPGDAEKKKLLARAGRRDAAVLKAKARLEKGAYFQGTEEPTPGKPQYKKEEADAIRDKADKQMTGQAPFPGVGKVDGLHPSPESVTVKDELKRKELLNRASLKAKFVKAMDQADSQWQVFAGDTLVFSAAVKELTGGYTKVATRDFGTKLIANIREYGVEKAANLVRSAQMPEIPAAPMGVPDAASAAMPAAPMGEPTAEDALEQADEGGVGSPADTVAGMAKDAKEMSDTLEELAKTMKEEAPAEEGLEGLAPATASLQKMRVKLHSALLAGVEKVASDLNEQVEELALYNADDLTAENQETIAAMAQDCVEETKVSLAEANELLASFVNYVKGTENVQKQASREVAMKKLAEESSLEGKLDELISEMEAEEAPATERDLAPLFEEEAPVEVEMLDAADAEVAPMAADADDALLTLDSNDANVEMKPEDLSKLPSNAKVEVKMASEFDLSTREGRAAYRMKLAGDATKMNPILEESAKLQDNSHDGLAKVETVKEKHDAIYDVATAPPKVRKDAEELMNLVKAGTLSADDVDALVTHGLDAEAAKYFKAMWKDVEGGGEFATQLVKEHAQAKLDEAMATYKVKIARAYDLAYQMVERGLCSRDAQVLSAQADEIMKYNDSAFDSLVRVVAKHAPLALTKEASRRLPNVGFLGNDETPAQEESEDLLTGLNRAFSGRNGRY